MQSRARVDVVLLLVLAAGVAVRLLALAAWPFVVEGDGGDYLERIVTGSSCLLQATGYVFFLRPVGWVAAQVGVDPALVLRHTLPWLQLASIALLHVATRPLLGRGLAGAVAGLLAVDPLIATTACTSRPESLQLGAWLATLAAAAWCLRSPAPDRRRPFVLGVAWGAAFLVKFNGLALAPLCALAVLAGTVSWAQRGRRLALLAAGATATIVVFLATFHRPATGTWRLSAGVGWHRMCNLESLGVPVESAAGPHTRLGQVLVLELPDVTAGHNGFHDVRAFRRERPYVHLERWRALLDAPDAVAIDALHGAACIAPGAEPDLRDPRRFCRLYRWLGLEHADRLLNAIWWENVRHAPARFLRAVALRLDDAVRFERHHRPYLPLAVAAADAGAGTAGAPPSPAVLRLANTSEEGVAEAVSRHARAAPARWLGALALLPRVPDVVLWLLLVAGASRHGFALCRAARRGPISWFAFGTWLALLALLVFSALALSFRVKEMVVAMPLVLLGIAVLFRSPRGAPPRSAAA